MICEFLIDCDGYQMDFKPYDNGSIFITISDPSIIGRDISFILDKEDTDFVINKLKELRDE